MKRSIAIGLLLGAIGCGSGSETTAPVSAGQPSGTRQLVEEEPGSWTERGAGAEAPAEEAAPASVHPSVTSCLGLAKEKRWAEAVVPCTEAARNAPTNREVADALAKAKQEAASRATASATEAAQKALGGVPEAPTAPAVEGNAPSIPTELP